MAVGADGIADGSPPEFRAGLPGDFAQNVPEGEVDPRDGSGAGDAMSVPEVLAKHHLPEVLDAGGVFADDQFGEVFDRGDNAAGMPFEGRLAPAEQAGLIGEHLDEDPVPHAGIADEGFDLGDLHGSGSRGSSGRRLAGHHAEMGL